MIDKISTLNSMGFAIGSMFGPILGGKLTDEYGFRNACDIMFCAAMIGAVLNIALYLPDLLCKKPTKFQESMVEYQNSLVETPQE